MSWLDKLFSRERIWNRWYRKNVTAGLESVSGVGSSLAQAKNIIAELPKLFREFNITSILDAPCGDFNWMKRVALTGIDYIGIDIVKDLIVGNRARYEFPRDRLRFMWKDLTKDALPEMDLVLCRDCLVHFSFKDAHGAIENFVKSGAKYLLTTTFLNCRKNKNIKTGKWRPLNLTLPPFNFPPPLYIVDEECPDDRGKMLGLWKCECIK